MQTETFFYQSSNHSDRVAAYFFRPDEQPYRGVIQLSHGMCESIPQYSDFCKFFCGSGFVVCGNDHLGHGSTAADRKQLGWFGQQNGISHMVQDMKALSDLIKNKFPEMPHYLLGHSMGSFLVRLFICQFPRQISGCILSGTGIGAPFLNAALEFARHQKKRFGSKAVDPFLAFFLTHSEQGGSMLYRPLIGWANSDKDKVDSYLHDPKRNFLFTTGGFYDLLQLFQRVNQPAYFRSVEKDLPILLLSGKLDPVGGFGKGVLEVEKRLKQCGINDVTVKLYPNMRHEVLLEKERITVYRDLLLWLKNTEKNVPSG